tara:strand:+ start:52 stop:1047 length:996 start_codon:yes stop_codon:yes gene_type:complete
MRKIKKILATGTAGFIGSCFVERVLQNYDVEILSIDCMSYASNKKRIEELNNHQNHSFSKINLIDSSSIEKTIENFQPDYLINFAAESHVDNSLEESKKFLESNTIGVYNLLESIRKAKRKNNIIFHQISTDEVFGDLNLEDEKFTEYSCYKPSSPYSSTKASADHLVRAWSKSYNLKYIITNCSNNYGPFQHDEKLIPKTIKNALEKKPIPVYGNGKNIRDWIYVYDHIDALIEIMLNAREDSTYLIGANSEKTNIEVIRKICLILDEYLVVSPENSHLNLIDYVDDRPGHDFRYAINADKIHNDIGWVPKFKFDEGLRNTIDWYLKKYK